MMTVSMTFGGRHTYVMQLMAFLLLAHLSCPFHGLSIICLRIDVFSTADMQVDIIKVHVSSNMLFKFCIQCVPIHCADTGNRFFSCHTSGSCL